MTGNGIGIGNIISEFKELTCLLVRPWSDIWHRTSVVECAIGFLFIPFVLVSIEASVISQEWALPLSENTIFQPDVLPLAFTSSYVHTSPQHLWGNVGGYILIMSALFPLSIIAGLRRRLIGISLFNLLIVPFMVSWASLILPHYKFAMGFSGVNAAFLGTLLVFVFSAWSDIQEQVNPIWSLAPGLFSLSAAFSIAPAIFPYLPLLPTYIAGFGLAGTAVTVIALRRGNIESCREFNPYRNSVMFWSILMCVIGFLGLFVAIPPTTNILAHLTGYYVGFFLPFAIVTGSTLNNSIVQLVS